MADQRGWLLKEGRPLSWAWGRQWLRRFFILDAEGQCIRYYVQPDDQQPRGLIDLSAATLVDSKECLETKKKDYCFGIITPKQTYYLIADDAGVVWTWTAAIHHTISRNKRQAQPSASETSQAQSSSKSLSSSTSSSSNNGKSTGRSADQRAADSAIKHFPRRILQELDLNPAAKSHTASFNKFRRERPANLSSADNQLERLKNRIFKLLYTDRSKFSSREHFEKSVVSWDSNSSCKCCNASFSGFSFGKSKTHCRLCGSTVCDNDRCSSMLNLLEIGHLTGVLRSSKVHVSEREAILPVCEQCETDIKQAGKSAIIAQAGKGATQLQMLYEKACQLRIKLNSDLEKFEDIVTQISRGNTTPFVRSQAEQLSRTILPDIKRLEELAAKMERLPVQNKDSQRLQFQASVYKTFSLWCKETKSRVLSLANALSR
eukprot:m.108220 g.108220  ORF g.108220 m.108220 type:complete len:432 (+) comp15210_c0_seq3:115-1410(+)